MAETFQPNVPWHRLHDPPVHPGGPLAPWTVRPSSLQEIIDICKRDPDRGRLHALGSHWALSEAARSDSVFIETHDPDDGHEALGHTLWNVIPHAMDASRREWMAQQRHPTATYVHIESGIIGDDWSQDEADPPLPGGGETSTVAFAAQTGLVRTVGTGTMAYQGPPPPGVFEPSGARLKCTSLDPDLSPGPLPPHPDSTVGGSR